MQSRREHGLEEALPEGLEVEVLAKEAGDSGCGRPRSARLEVVLAKEAGEAEGWSLDEESWRELDETGAEADRGEVVAA